jgi:hypothetical protein
MQGMHSSDTDYRPQVRQVYSRGMTMSLPAWPAILARYRAPAELVTRAQRRPFRVESVGSSLVVTPSTGRARTIHAHEFERAIPLIDRPARAPVQAVTFNSSYVEAIIDDIRR